MNERTAAVFLMCMYFRRKKVDATFGLNFQK